MKEILITKASGETTDFDPEKLRLSLQRSGADQKIINEIIEDLEKRLYEGITTKKIYQIAFRMLKKKSRHSASKYKLKRAIMELGPTGFPFEKFVSKILKFEGFSVMVGQIVKGKCVNHEIDVIAEKENQHFMVECKFHNQAGINCDVKIPLYIQARFKDVELEMKNVPGNGTRFQQGWLVTNTKFTGDAIQYGECAGLHLLGWDYPHGQGLKNKIDTSGLFPLTCLTTITLREKQFLLSKGLVLCKEISNNPEMLSELNFSSARRKNIVDEAKALCKEE